MKKVCMFIMFIVLSLVITSSSYGFRSEFFGTIEEFQDYVLKEGNIKINNFSISEGNAFMAKGLSNITVSFSAVNRGESSKHFVVMMRGVFVGDNDGWDGFYLSCAPMMSTISAGRTENITKSVYVEPGTLNKINFIIVTVIGDL